MSWKLISGPSPSGDRASPASAKDMRPKARGYHTANMVGSKLIIFGGSDGGECFNDVWVYDVDAHNWKAVQIPLTFRRLSHTATIVGSYLFVIGGHDGNEYSNDVLLLNLVTMTWDRRRVYGLPPSGRGYHGTVLYDSRLLVIGGFDGSEVFGDVWILELAVHSYYSQISHFTIEV
jgi:N-acetylneuraminic acid mutarotase